MALHIDFYIVVCSSSESRGKQKKKDAEQKNGFPK